MTPASAIVRARQTVSSFRRQPRAPSIRAAVEAARVSFFWGESWAPRRAVPVRTFLRGSPSANAEPAQHVQCFSDFDQYGKPSSPKWTDCLQVERKSLGRDGQMYLVGLPLQRGSAREESCTTTRVASVCAGNHANLASPPLSLLASSAPSFPLGLLPTCARVPGRAYRESDGARRAGGLSLPPLLLPCARPAPRARRQWTHFSNSGRTTHL